MMLAGDVFGCQRIIVDDLVSTGATLDRAVSACSAEGAQTAHAAVTHALFTPAAGGLLANAALETIAITDTVAAGGVEATALENKASVVTCTKLFAEAIDRMHCGGSVAELLQD